MGFLRGRALLLRTTNQPTGTANADFVATNQPAINQPTTRSLRSSPRRGAELDAIRVSLGKSAQIKRIAREYGGVGGTRGRAGTSCGEPRLLLPEALSPGVLDRARGLRLRLRHGDAEGIALISEEGAAAKQRGRLGRTKRGRRRGRRRRAATKGEAADRARAVGRRPRRRGAERAKPSARRGCSGSKAGAAGAAGGSKGPLGGARLGRRSSEESRPAGLRSRRRAQRKRGARAGRGEGGGGGEPTAGRRLGRGQRACAGKAWALGGCRRRGRCTCFALLRAWRRGPPRDTDT